MKKLEEAVENLEFDRDANRFHEIVRTIALRVGFKETEKWYEADILPEIFQFPTLEALEKIENEFPGVFENYARREKYERGEEYIISTTHHPTFQAIKEGVYIARTIMSNSTLGLVFLSCKTTFRASEINLNMSSIK